MVVVMGARVPKITQKTSLTYQVSTSPLRVYSPASAVLGACSRISDFESHCGIAFMAASHNAWRAGTGVWCRDLTPSVGVRERIGRQIGG